MNNNRGFALVELLATLLVLSIILLIAVPKFEEYKISKLEKTFIVSARNILREIEYSNIDKTISKKTLKEFNIDNIPENVFDLENSYVYTGENDDQIYIDLVGINTYKNMYLCKMSSNSKTIYVQKTPCE